MLISDWSSDVCSSDLVLEDNARTPSGVSYMLENRETMLQMFPELFAKIAVREVGDYPLNLLKSLAACAPPACNGTPTVAVLTPGIHNSAYFEHRSEEHTSELQSLMRISYAVFS